MDTSPRKTVHVSLRLPEDMHGALTDLAKRDRRSLHGEIVYILEQFLGAEEREAKKAAA